MTQPGYELLKIMNDLDGSLIEEAAEPLTPVEVSAAKGVLWVVRQKKHRLRKALMIAATVALIGCMVIGGLGVWKYVEEKNVPPDGDASCRAPIYSGNSLEEFLGYWQESHFLVIPVLRSVDIGK